MPYFVRNPDGTDGMGRRQCTSEYKLAPINRKVRELLGAAAPDFRIEQVWYLSIATTTLQALLSLWLLRLEFRKRLVPLVR